MSKQICLNGQRKMLLDNFLGEEANFPIFDRRSSRKLQTSLLRLLGLRSHKARSEGSGTHGRKITSQYGNHRSGKRNCQWQKK